MNDLLISAQQQQISYLDFAFGLFNAEIDHRNQQNLTKRLRNAKLPADHDLDLCRKPSRWNIPKTSNSTARMYLAPSKTSTLSLWAPAEQEKPSLLPGFVTKLYSRVIRLFQVHGTAIYLLKMKDITKSAAVNT